MSVQVIPVLKDHYRAGFSRPLLWFDGFLLSLVLLDTARFRDEIGLPVSATLLLGIKSIPSTLVWDAIRLVLFLLVILPALIAFLRIAGWFGDRLGGPLGKSSSAVVIVHCIMCSFFVYCLTVTRNMQVLSAWVQVDAGYRFAFSSYFYSLLIASGFLKTVFESMGTLVRASFAALIGFAIHGKELAEPVKHYLARASLSDLCPELLPIRSPGRLDTSRTGNPVRVRFVSDAYDRTLRNYQRLPSGSADAMSYLEGEFERCKEIILTQLVQPSANGADSGENGLSLGLFAGPRRAFEAALARFPRPRLLVTSPFTSPSLLTLLRWQAFMTGDQLETIEFHAGDYFRSWNEQESEIIDKIYALKSHSSRTVVLILSEVSYASGRRVPLAGFLRSIADRGGDPPIRVIVDGTNAVGNRCLVTSDPRWDCYVFSPQRWLMAAESCGILLVRGGSNGNGPVPPGQWKSGTRKTDVQVRTLAGVVGAMDVIRERGIEYFFSHCERLKKEFRLGLPETVQVIGDQSGLDETFILSCCPEGGHKWRFDNPGELEGELASKTIKASVLRLDPRQPWVRVAIPFYMDAREVNRLCNFLEETTK